MNSFNFCYNNSLINKNIIKKHTSTLELLVTNISQELKNKYNTKYAFLNLPWDQEVIDSSKEAADKLKSLNITLFLQIGIGGSKLGTVAIFEAINGIYYNNQNPKIKYYTLDTIDQSLISSTIEIIKQEFSSGGKVALAIVTKSGTTPETIANAAIFVNLIKSYYKQDYNKYIYAITDKDSKLYNLALEQNYGLLTIPKQVGGRYSALSYVGLLPLSIFNIDIESLCSGARDMQKNCLSSDVLNNQAAISAAIIYEHYIQGKNILDTFLFSPSLRMLGEWYRQLIGESLGKKYSLDNNKVEVGITPTVSIGTTDLHSVAQLYLGGPRDKMTTFVNFISEDSSISIPDNNIANLVPVLENKNIGTIKSAIFSGVLKAYKQDNRPFMCIDLKYQDSYSIGQFIMLKMIETVYLGALLNINVFDQPAVEHYKTNTKEILEKY